MGEVSEFERKKMYLNQYQEAQRKIAGLTAEMEKWGCLATKVNQACVPCLIGAGGAVPADRRSGFDYLQILRKISSVSSAAALFLSDM